MKLSIVKPACAFCGSLLMCGLFLFTHPACDKEAKVILEQQKAIKVAPLEFVTQIILVTKS